MGRFSPPFSLLLFLSVLGDTFWGGHFYRFHPVVAMGQTGRTLERLFLRSVRHPLVLKWMGVLLVLGVVLPFSCATALILVFLDRAGLAWISGLLTVFWGYQLLAGKSLETHVAAVLVSLETDDLEGARQSLSRIVSRDTETLERSAVIRGAIESLSENANDALMAPLFYFALGGVPLLMAYKAVSTLDSQVGYKTPPYRDLGWASARLDDLLAFLPARLSLLLLLLLFGYSAAKKRNTQFKALFREALSNRLNHPSPNSAHTMSAFAALLGIRLGGGAFYGNRWIEKPWIGFGRESLTVEDLSGALSIFRKFRWSIFAMTGCATALLYCWRVWGGAV